MAKACIIHRALHQKSPKRNPKESDFNFGWRCLRAVSAELNLTPSVKDLHLHTSHRGNTYFPCVVMGTHPGFIHFVATHTHRNTHTHRVKVSVFACERTFCKNADARILFTHTQRTATGYTTGWSQGAKVSVCMFGNVLTRQRDVAKIWGKG